MANNPFQQLDVIRNIAKQKKKVRDCYKLLYHKELWIKAYHHIYRNGSLFDQDKEGYASIEIGIQMLRKGEFRFQSSSSNTIRQHFKKDVIVQELCLLEVIHMILEAIYDPLKKIVYNNKSQITFQQIRQIDPSITWGLYGELNERYEQALLTDFHPYMNEKIEDPRFLLLFHHLVKSRILHDQKEVMPQYRSSSKALLNLLKNSMLKDLDVFVKRLKNGIKKKQMSQYRKTDLAKKVWSISYIRSGGMFLIAVSGTKANAEDVKVKVEKFLMKYASTQLENGIGLAHIRSGIPFLGYKLIVKNKIKSKKYNISVKDNHVHLLIPNIALQKFAQHKGYGNLILFQSIHRSYLIVKTEIQILTVYNKELKTFTEKYINACNFHYLSRLYDLAESSFIKTLAFKRKSSVKRVRNDLKKHIQGRLSLRTVNSGKVISFITYKDMKRKRDA